MDIQLFIDMLNVDSTTGKEGEFADYLVHRLASPGCRIERFPVESMSCDEGYRQQENLLLSDTVQSEETTK